MSNAFWLLLAVALGGVLSARRGGRERSPQTDLKFGEREDVRGKVPR